MNVSRNHARNRPYVNSNFRINDRGTGYVGLTYRMLHRLPNDDVCGYYHPRYTVCSRETQLPTCVTGFLPGAGRGGDRPTP